MNSINNPTPEQYLSKVTRLKTLKRKSVVLRQLSQDDKSVESILTNAFDSYTEAIYLINSIRTDYTTEESKQQIFESASQIYEGALLTAFELYQSTNNSKYLKEAFTISEQSKAFILLNALSENSTKEFATIPDQLIVKEGELKVRLSYYKNQLTRAITRDDSLKIGENERKVFMCQKEYDQFLVELNQDFPEYYELKYNTSVITAKNTQKQILDDKTALIEYFVSDSSLYTFSLTTKSLALNHEYIGSEFLKLVSNFRKATTDYELIQNQPDIADSLYIANAYQLYNRLLYRAIKDFPGENEQPRSRADGVSSLPML